MLKNILKFYLFSIIVLYISLLFFVPNRMIFLYISLFFISLLYFYIIFVNYYKIKYNYLSIIFIFSLTFVALFNFFSYYYTKSFLMFNTADAVYYDIFSLKISKMPFKNGLNYIFENFGIDDAGVPLFISTCYRIIPSNLFVNFIYILCGLITAFSLFHISREFMSIKYAKLCTIAFALSSFLLYYHSSGLKESIMIMLIILFFDFYYQFIKTKKIKNLIFSILCASSFILFRIPIIFFIIAVICVNSLIGIKNIKIRIPLIILSLLSFLIAYPFFQYSINRYLLSGDISKLLYIRETENMITGGIRFTYITNIVSQLIGPFPTIVPSGGKEALSFYAPGLLFRCFISIPFFLGINYAIKSKDKLIYPMILFIIFEMVSLIIVIEGLELRKSMPHLPFIYIIAFYYMDKYDFKRLDVKKYFSSIALIFFLILILVMVLVWNMRYTITI